ncbi:MAG TPA: chorismate synthase, partial [Myxococcota bacterium]|nr:chorismate synthase [Myxococcota bacterium]
MKPISTTLTPRASINLKDNAPGPTVYERSDFCAVQRACVVGEAMLAFVMLNALMDKIGGDDKESMHHAFSSLLRGRTHELSMKESSYRFNYDQHT